MERIIDLLNIAGLCVGLIGAIMVFIFGVPKKIDTGGYVSLALEQKDVKEEKEIVRYKFWGNFGLALIIASFALQIVSQVVLYRHDSSTNKPQTLIYIKIH